MFVKLCGIRSLYDLENAIELGFDAFGIVLTKKSKRFLNFEAAIKLAEYAKGKIKSVAVAYNFTEIEEIYKNFDYLQLYSPVNADNLIYSSNDLKNINEPCKYFMYDNSHGKGIYTKVPSEFLEIKNKLIIAGGLNPNNIRKTVKKYKPFGVDVSSGVEKYGLKQFELMKKFVCEAKNAN